MATRTKEQKERIRAATSKAMKLIAERTKCPSCQRKSALSIKYSVTVTCPVEVCRWCDYRRLIDSEEIF